MLPRRMETPSNAELPRVGYLVGNEVGRLLCFRECAATLYAPALATASAFGKIEVFHGEKTNCKVPDPVALLQNPRTRIKPY